MDVWNSGVDPAMTGGVYRCIGVYMCLCLPSARYTYNIYIYYIICNHVIMLHLCHNKCISQSA